MAESTIVKTKRDGTITIAALGGGAFDAAGNLNAGAKSYTVSYEPGDFNLSIPGEAVNSFLDRGRFPSPPALRLGDDQPMTGSFSAYFRDMTDAAVAALTDLLTEKGYISTAWESSLDSASGANDAEVFTVDLKVTMTNSGNPSDTHFLVIPFCRLSGSIKEGDPNTIEASFTSYAVRPSVVA